ncbi:hypothetical protein Cni_G07190 [Canna indica]|uniref:Uncharacterized protein n=1 Tax=Canna indica TaxID=4628 RepID=A0AAQ3JYD1_9LILI|nr:hypothetical protein Cni_G07190 [Canna indica]
MLETCSLYPCTRRASSQRFTISNRSFRPGSTLHREPAAMAMSSRCRPMSKLRRLAAAPYRALCRARDLYVKSLGGCAGKAQRPPFSAAMPRARSYAFHQHGRDDDVGELIRAASTRSLPVKGSRDDGGAGAVPRSQSVAGVVMRIDEEKQCSFEGDVKLGLGLGMPPAYPRSRSCAVVRRRSQLGGVVA